MAGRDITAGMVTGLEAGVVRECLIGRFDILSDPLTAWTGPGTLAPTSTGDPALDGQIFINLAPYFGLTEVIEDQGIGGPITLTVSGHDLDEDILRQIVRDQREWRGRSAWLWLALLNADEATIITSPMRIKTGVMTQMMVHRDKDGATVGITIDQDLGRAQGAAWRWIDHPRLFAADTFSSFVIPLSNRPQGLGDPNINNNGPDFDDNDTDGSNRFDE